MKGADRKSVVYLVEDTALCHPAGQFTVGKYAVLYYAFRPKSILSLFLVHGNKLSRVRHFDAQVFQSGAGSSSVMVPPFH